MSCASAAHRFAAGMAALTVAACVAGTARPAAAADQVYFSAVDNIAAQLVQRINAETVRIDMSAWYLTDSTVYAALLNRWKAGVKVRLIGDRGSIFEIDQNTRNTFYYLASQGLPIRLRYFPTWYPEIDHWKTTIFVGQNLVAFGSPNYTPFELTPYSSTNYHDELALFTTDSTLVNAFKTKFDRFWNDTTAEPESLVPTPPYFKNWDDACANESACSDYRTIYPHPVPMVIDTRRLEPDNPMPPEMVWGQGPDFNDRLVSEINKEATAIDFVIYRLTVSNIADALLARKAAGVPIRLFVEPNEYLNRVWPEFWLTHANVDKLWAAGIPMKWRLHDGLTHMKTLITSTVATIASSNYAAAWQRDQDYFMPATAKPTIYTAIKNRFQTMWNDTAGFTNFVPQKPDAPTPVGPASGAAGVSTMPTLTWQTATFATSYDVYLGSSQASMSRVGNVPAQLVNNPPATYSFTISSRLANNATYYWKVISRTNATPRDPTMIASSSPQAFTTDLAHAAADFDGDGRSDIAVYRPAASGVWYVRSGGSSWASQWGVSGDIPMPGDYDGDRRTDLAVYRPGTGEWFVRLSSQNYAGSWYWQWGQSGDVPLARDFDGDGKIDPAVYRPSSGQWMIRYSTLNYVAGAGNWTFQWGVSSDTPVPADYDADGKTDLAVYRPSTGEWFIRYSSQNYAVGAGNWYFQWGVSSDVPIPADFDGDGKADIAVYRKNTGEWYIRNSTQGYAVGAGNAYFQWGQPGDLPRLIDADGDGLTDIAVFRSSNGVWYIRYSSQNYVPGAGAWSVQWGVAGDVPLPPY